MAANNSDSTEPIITPNPLLTSYYESPESRIGYRLVLGGTRHFGYYAPGTTWPFPVGKALRAMEDKLFRALDLPPGSRVIDAGCGVGHVALYMARQGLRVTAFDIVAHHAAKARRNAARARIPPPGEVTARRMDYHHLETIPDASYDGLYTMETLVHATDPQKVLAGFYRVLRPGGRMANFEYDHLATTEETAPARVVSEMHLVNKYTGMATNARSHPGVFQQMLEEAGFVDVKVEDYSANIRPMLRLFHALAVVPYFFIRLLGLERFFINTVAGARGYAHQEYWRYVAISATKPGPPEGEAAKTK
jgi:ubiquinone/menaquinone biosynthesis C-methylase UbiE